MLRRVDYGSFIVCSTILCFFLLLFWSSSLLLLVRCVCLSAQYSLVFAHEILEAAHFAWRKCGVFCPSVFLVLSAVAAIVSIATTEWYKIELGSANDVAKIGLFKDCSKLSDTCETINFDDLSSSITGCSRPAKDIKSRFTFTRALMIVGIILVAASLALSWCHALAVNLPPRAGWVLHPVPHSWGRVFSGWRLLLHPNLGQVAVLRQKAVRLL